MTSQTVSLPLISTTTYDPALIGLIHPAKIIIDPKTVFLDSEDKVCHLFEEIKCKLVLTYWVNVSSRLTSFSEDIKLQIS